MVDTINKGLPWPNVFGEKNTKKQNKIKNTNTVIASLKMKYGCILNLSIFPVIPIGFDDPCTCKAIKCNTTNAANTNGNK